MKYSNLYLQLIATKTVQAEKKCDERSLDLYQKLSDKIGMTPYKVRQLIHAIAAGRKVQ